MWEVTGVLFRFEKSFEVRKVLDRECRSGYTGKILADLVESSSRAVHAARRSGGPTAPGKGIFREGWSGFEGKRSLELEIKIRGNPARGVA